jgi:NitT/TauT family transport system permease protein
MEEMVSEEAIPAAKTTGAGRGLGAAFHSRRWLATLVIVGLIAIVWEGAKALFNIPDAQLPHLAAIVGEFGERTQGGQGPVWAVLMLQNAGVTLGEAVTGFVLGGLLGCALAILFTASPLLERGLLPYVIGSQLVPILAIAPMVVIGMGSMGAPDWLSKAIIATYLTFFPVTIGMSRGLRSASPDALALMRSYAASGWQVFWKLRLPASLPYLFTALKVSATASVIGAIIGELPVGSVSGIGVVIVNSVQYVSRRPQNLWAAVLVASLIGLFFYGVVALTERLVVRGQGSGD